MLSPRALCSSSVSGGDVVEWRDPNDHKNAKTYVVAFASLEQKPSDGKFFNMQSSYRASKKGTATRSSSFRSVRVVVLLSFAWPSSNVRSRTVPTRRAHNHQEASDVNRVSAGTVPRMHGNDIRVSSEVKGTAKDKKHRWVALEDLRSAGNSEKGRPLKGSGGCSFTNGPVMGDQGQGGL